MNDTAILVPSRGRPQSIVRLIEALQNTLTKADLYVGIDESDPLLDDYVAIAARYKSAGVKVWVGSRRMRFGPTLNALAQLTAHERELDALGTGIVYGNDLVQGENLPTQMGMTSNIVTTLGYAVPEGFTHLYIDDYFLALGCALGKVTYLPDVIVEHLHYSAGKSQQDQTYEEANSPENWNNDRTRFSIYVLDELPTDVLKLRKLLD
jgi:hypothetical protein